MYYDHTPKNMVLKLQSSVNILLTCDCLTIWQTDERNNEAEKDEDVFKIRNGFKKLPIFILWRSINRKWLNINSFAKY